MSTSNSCLLLVEEVSGESVMGVIVSTGKKLAARAVKLPKRADPNLTQQSLTAARESWWMFNIIAEMVSASEKLGDITPAVAIFGSARLHEGHRYYALTEQICAKLS